MSLSPCAVFCAESLDLIQVAAIPLSNMANLSFVIFVKPRQSDRLYQKGVGKWIALIKPAWLQFSSAHYPLWMVDKALIPCQLSIYRMLGKIYFTCQAPTCYLCNICLVAQFWTFNRISLSQKMLFDFCGFKCYNRRRFSRFRDMRRLYFSRSLNILKINIWRTSLSKELPKSFLSKTKLILTKVFLTAALRFLWCHFISQLKILLYRLAFNEFIDIEASNFLRKEKKVQ